MQHLAQTLSLEAHVRAAWQTQLAAAVHTPGLLPELVRRRSELLPRFAAYYTQLRALPRRVRRALQRRWQLPLAGVALLLALGQSPGLAATIPVSAGCTLVDAITAANTDTATGGCPAGSGADTIVLPAGSTQTLTEVNNETYGPTGLPVVSSVVTIAGNGSTIVRDSGAPEFRLFAVNSMGDLTLNEAMVSGGRVSFDYVASRDLKGGGIANYGGILTVTDSTISGNSTDEGEGGGVANYGGILTVTTSTISGNTVSNNGGGGGVYNNGGTLTITNSTIVGNFHFGYRAGAGVYNSGGTLTIMNSTISDNFSNFEGGGLANFGGIVTVTNSTIANNYSSNSDASGGGVFNRGGTLTMTNSTISGNRAYDGGGVYNNGGTLTVIHSTIADNFTGGGWGGGMVNYGGTLTVTHSTITGNSAYRGGGVNNTGTLTVTTSTISGNFARESGGGVNNYGTLTVTNSTISGNVASYGEGGGVANRAGTLTLARTLVADNTAPTGPEIVNSVTYGGTIVADNHNLFGVDGTAGVVGFSPGPTDIVPPAGVLLPDILDPTLAFNGGPTQTHALILGSPAIDAGGSVCTDASGVPLDTDQRGKPRLVDGDGDGSAACDIGAFEFFPG